MKKSYLKKSLLVLLSLAVVYGMVVFVGCGGSSSGNGGGGGGATTTTYTGTLYMATEGGGHVGVYNVSIDPSNATTPISLTGAATKIDLEGNHRGIAALGGGTNVDHVFHDVRLDAAANKLYFSSILSSSPTTTPNTTTYTTLGYVDLTNNSVHDYKIATDSGTGKSLFVYCGSGLNSTHYFPITMLHEAYIDSIPKSLISGATATFDPAVDTTIKRTLISTFRGDSDYLYAHGAANAAGDKLYVAVNNTTAGGGGTGANMNGSITGYLLNTSDVIAGNVTSAKVVASTTVSGLSVAGGSIAYRSSFTPDGTKILQSGKDRVVILNVGASSLSSYVTDTNIGADKAGVMGTDVFGAAASVENHDVMSTPDGKYAILMLRYVDSAGQAQTSGLQLYDIANKKAIGKITNTCGLSSCHAPDTVARGSCGVDGKLTAH